MNFVKLQATGNDFVLVDARHIDRDWSLLAKEMCRRRFSVGADGLLLVLPSEAADLRLRMFNPDGSEAEACGNGLRCFGRYAVDRELVNGSTFTVETMAGVRSVSIQGDKGVQVTMGVPVFEPMAIPVVIEGRDKDDRTPIVDYSLDVDGMRLSISCVSMGNPHAVCFLEEPVSEFPLEVVGPRVEHHHVFPNRVNFEVVNVASRNEMRARVWERGAGETLSCGSGACAIAAVSISRDLTGTPVNVALPGGTLTVEWGGTGEVLLTGPAEVVFSGEWSD